MKAALLLTWLSGLCLVALSGCGEDAPSAPSLAEVKKFKGYPVYYAGEEVLGQPITGGLEGEAQVDPQERVWVIIYGDCELPEGEGGCAPFQIHNYSTCTRWASSFSQAPVGLNRRAPLRPFRGAKARYRRAEHSIEIFTGRTTITIGGGDSKMLKPALRQLREVHQAKPARLPPPVPRSLSGKLPCQGPALKRRAERRLSVEEVEHHLRALSDHYSKVNCGMRADDHFLCMATYFNPTPPAKVEIDIEATAKPFRFSAVDCRLLEPEPDTEDACEALMFDLNKPMSDPPA
ncbi:MAG TPA: hypothetical protein VEW07_05640 [Solirubrobacterales bacterium]|nr:hypothetical protein [Solirubrobacterales bacterium]